MELIGQYEFDSLSFIDREYDIPEVHNAVNAMISAEMRSFQPADYLAKFPCPEIKFANSQSLQLEFQRCSSGMPSAKLDVRRYLAEKPEPALEKDVQAWRNAVSNIKSQLQHQENRLMNLELMEEHVSNVWLQHNSALEQIYNHYSEKTDAVNKELRELQKSRQAAQERVYPDLVKLVYRRDKAVIQKLQCQAAVQQIDEYLTHHNFHFEKHLAEQAELTARDLLSAEHNSTVRAYETVNETPYEEPNKRQKLT